MIPELISSQFNWKENQNWKGIDETPQCALMRWGLLEYASNVQIQRKLTNCRSHSRNTHGDLKLANHPTYVGISIIKIRPFKTFWKDKNKFQSRAEIVKKRNPIKECSKKINSTFVEVYNLDLILMWGQYIF